MAALLSLVSAIAQEGEIIYTDYEPDLHVYTPYSFYSMDVDLDFDSIPDIQLYFHRPGPGSYHYAILAINDDFEIALCSEGDVIPDLENWAQEKRLYFEGQSNSYGFRQQKEDGYCYGWFRAFRNEDDVLFFDAFAYCTAVDYPLKWGQENILQGNHYDFSAVCETGQILYYAITNEKNHEVKVTCPGHIIYPEPDYEPIGGYIGYEMPTGNLVIPSSFEHYGETYTVTAIDTCAFSSCDALTQVTIPNTVTDIYFYAFRNTGIEGNLVIPQSVISIQDKAFCNCSGITGLALPNSIQIIGDYTFAKCVNITELVIPNSVQHIGERAFYLCNGITGHLTIPESVTELGENAFEKCSGISGLTLSSSVTYIPAGAFMECTGLTGAIIIPEGVLSVGSYAFQKTNISELTIPTTLNNFDDYTLKNCNCLKTLNYNAINCYFGHHGLSGAENLETVNFGNAVQNINHSCFYGCKNLKLPLNFPNSLQNIGDEAFCKCTSLTGKLVFPDSIQNIGNVAFADCTGLSGQLVLPKHLKVIGQEAFENCTGLTSFVMPDSLEIIGDKAFVGCTHLSGTFIIPEKVSHIGTCPINLTGFSSIATHATTPPNIFSYTFDGKYHLPLFIPNGTKETYEAHPYWGLFTNIVEMNDNMPLGSEWFYEILNDNGSITFQHLEYTADTAINSRRTKVIMRTNTMYDKGVEVTHEYVYEENGIVYWWNKTLNEFTVLYNLNAETGDEWQIKVGTETITVHVDAVDVYDYEGRTYKMLQVSDENDVFGGNIVCGIGHLTSFFPERLMSKLGNYRVEGIRCCWKDGELVFKYGDKNCDEIYIELHNGIEESDNQTFRVYPNPAKGFITIETEEENAVYKILNIMGQAVLSGSLNGAKQVNVSGLSDGMYFIKVGQETVKFVVGR